MIERLLAADAALERGEVDAAERVFSQVAEADPRNAIAAVGMGRVAASRDDAVGARTWFQRALEIDPDEAAARRLLTALDREMAALEGLPPAAGPEVAAAPARAAAFAPAPAPPSMAAPAPATPGLDAPAAAPEVAPAPTLPGSDATRPATPVPAARRSLFDRIRAWLGLSGRR